MQTENNYDFFKRMRVVHRPDRREEDAALQNGEFEINNLWKIVIPVRSGKILRHAASDFQDYLLSSMNVSLPVVPESSPRRGDKILLLTSVPEYAPESGDLPAENGEFLLDVSEKNGIVLCGFDERALFRGTLHLEDTMNLREAPFLKPSRCLRKMLTRMRSVHSGCGVDSFPDWQLNAIAHAGFNAIDLFVRGPDTSSRGYCNINDLIERAALFDLSVVFYSYLSSYKHPDEPGAEAFFDRVYGEMFRRHPGAVAIHLVGESLEFPSKDPHTTGKRFSESVRDGIPDTRPSPGWYPCCDYPDYIRRICDAVHRVKPDAEVILNTYNWGYMPLEERKALLTKLPKDITLHVTYDIFKINKRGDLSCPTMDYSISAADPGFYFTSEVETAASLGFRRIRVTGNLAGSTWDFGTVPYVPVPFRWAHRMEVLKHYLLTCGVTSFYENHHYGWWPNPCNDLEKELFASNGENDVESILAKVAARDYGASVAPSIVRVWKIWSRSMDHYVGTNEDQYGPWRTGPSYPFLFQPNISRVMANKEIKFPTAPGALFGSGIIKTLYMPYENANQSPGPLRYPVEIKELETFLDLWNTGLSELQPLIERMPVKKQHAGLLLYALGKFIRNSIRTTLHIKQWWILNMKLQIPSDRDTMLSLLDQIEALANEEILNVRDTFDAVKFDSRIGWEPSMEYVCDEWHLEWKLRQMQSMLGEIDAYRKMVQL